MDRNEEVEVCVVGGGPVGLTAAMLLRRLGVDVMLLNTGPTTSDRPKAHMLNQRSMEVFSELGIADTIYAMSTPAENMRRTGWYAGLAGPDPDYGRLIGSCPAWGEGYTDPDYIAASSCRTANLPQLRLEPVLYDAAVGMCGADRIRFGHQALTVTQDHDGVTVQAREIDQGREYGIRARYLIGADGGRTVGRQIGVSTTGRGELGPVSTVYFAADLSPWARESDTIIRYLINPAYGRSVVGGVLLAVGPGAWDRHSPEWYLNFAPEPGEDAPRDHESARERVRKTLGIPDLEMEVRAVSSWTLAGAVADRFGVGRVFLAGDAAHRNPPVGGLGMNTGIGDAYNLSWRLAQVVCGSSKPALLDDYELERRSLALTVVDRALANAGAIFAVDEALGIDPTLGTEENWRRIKEVWSDDPALRAKRIAVENGIMAQTVDFRDHNLEVGHSYQSVQAEPETESPDPIRIYRASTGAGHPLPHAPLTRLGERTSTRDLVAGGRWVLIVGERGEAWRSAAAEIQDRASITPAVIQIGHTEGDWLDSRCAWTNHRGVGPDGAVLVRPDRYVAWRWVHAPSAPAAELLGALEKVAAISARDTPGSLSSLPALTTTGRSND